jgi:predicted adenine nucleotide alpha hydrolase (AANH) superfamily ATPase
MNIYGGGAPLTPQKKPAGGGAFGSAYGKWREYDITGLFYNPNIHPETEFAKRLDGAKALFDAAGRPLIIRPDYMRREFEDFERRETGGGAASEISGARCEMCYAIRLSYTAKLAGESNFDAFSTSLLISPYQNHGLIKSICENQSRLCNIEFIYRDWRAEFRDGQRLARDLGLYRQKYCGCIFSIPKNKEAAGN